MQQIGAASPNPALLDYLDRLFEAVKARDVQTVETMFGERLSAQLPREVLEESLAIARAAVDSFRAPVRMLRFYHVTARLLAEHDRADDFGELQIELPFARPGSEAPNPSIRARNRLAAAHEQELKPKRRRWK